MSDLKNLLFFGLNILGFIVAIWAGLFIISLPIAYFEGTAKAEYLLTQKGIKVHWYKAAWMPDEIFYDANVRTQK